MIDVIERRGRVYHLKDLRIAAAALETASEQTLLGDPDVAYRKFFAHQFKRRRCAAPGSVEEWRDFFRPSR